jgi:hypothetical protein
VISTKTYFASNGEFAVKVTIYFQYGEKIIQRYSRQSISEMFMDKAAKLRGVIRFSSQT